MSEFPTEGQRPYRYSIPYPFCASGSYGILVPGTGYVSGIAWGYSGIIFEQTMFVLSKEKSIYQPSGGTLNPGAPGGGYYKDWMDEANSQIKFNAYVNTALIEQGPIIGFPGLSGSVKHRHYWRKSLDNNTWPMNLQVSEPNPIYDEDAPFADRYSSYTFYPVSSGYHLTTRRAASNNVLPCVNFKEYMLDMREQFQAIFGLMSFMDSDHNHVAILKDYYRRYLPSYAAYGVEYPYMLRTDSGLFPTNLLGGNTLELQDADIANVQFQPFVRLSGPGFRELYENSDFPFYIPISPLFCTNAGKLVYITQRELDSINDTSITLTPGRAIALQAASAGKFLVAGDMIESGNTKLYYSWATDENGNPQLVDSATLDIEDGVARYVINEINLGYGVCTPPTGFTFTFTKPSGTPPNQVIYGIQVFNTNTTISGYNLSPTPLWNLNGGTPLSGISCIWPPLETLASTGIEPTNPNWTDYIPYNYTRGLHVFDTAFWSMFNNTWGQKLYGGATISSPINGVSLWFRQADDYVFSTANYPYLTANQASGWKQLGRGRLFDQTAYSWFSENYTSLGPALPIIPTWNSNLLFLAGHTDELGTTASNNNRSPVFAWYHPDTFDFTNSNESNVESYDYETFRPSVFFYVYDHNPTAGINLSNTYILSEGGVYVNYNIADTARETVRIYNKNLNQIAGLTLSHPVQWDLSNSTYPEGQIPIFMCNGHLYGANAFNFQDTRIFNHINIRHVEEESNGETYWNTVLYPSGEYVWPNQSPWPTGNVGEEQVDAIVDSLGYKFSVRAQIEVVESRRLIYHPDIQALYGEEPLQFITASGQTTNFGTDIGVLTDYKDSIPNVIDPRGTALDNGDGSIIMNINHKNALGSGLGFYWTRVKEYTYGAEPVLAITEIFGPQGSPGFSNNGNWVYSYADIE